LSDGPHNVELKVNDTYGNQATTTWSFTVDATPPTLTNLLPSDGSVTNDNTPTISANYTDVSGIETTSIVLKVDGIVVNPQTLTATGVIYTPTNALSDGVHNLELSVQDNVNNVNTTVWSINIDATPPTANAGADIEINVGNTANFNGSASSDAVDSTPQLNFTWSISKDGTQITVLYGIAPSYVFNEAGEYEVTLTVRDSAGNEGSDAMTVTVTSPGEQQGADYWWIIVIIVIIIVVVILILFLLMRRKKAAAETPPPTPYTPVETQAEPYQEQPSQQGYLPPPPPPMDQSQGEYSGGVVMVANCPLCSASIPPGQRTCPDCGYELGE
jgi:hypothetical protein